jgi:ketosteroid isomerase-like protein
VAILGQTNEEPRVTHPSRLTLLIAAIGCTTPGSPRSPPADPAAREATITALEEQERRAVLEQDFASLERIWAEDFVVNTPRSEVAADRGALLDLFRKGVAHYQSFDRRIELIRFTGDHAIVMGAETVRPIGDAPLAGQTVERRFTNFWRREGDTWRLVARHANVLPARVP